MAGQDSVGFVDEDWAGWPEASHVVGEDEQLLLRVTARVRRPRTELGRVTLHIGKYGLSHLEVLTWVSNRLPLMVSGYREGRPRFLGGTRSNNSFNRVAISLSSITSTLRAW